LRPPARAAATGGLRAPVRHGHPFPSRAAFWRGFVSALPFLLVVGPFGLVFGQVAAEAGLHIMAARAVSVLVIAGTARFTSRQLPAERAPAAVAVLAGLAVNLRSAMHSAALVPQLGAAPPATRALVACLPVDQTFASVADHERRPGMAPAERTDFHFGSAAPVVPVRIGARVADALRGRSIPPEYALGFAVPVAFLAILAPMVPTLAHPVAAALAFGWLRHGGGLLVAGLLAMVAGAEVERRQGGAA
jgi:predicted branched-subunit amino acid permease